MLEAIALVSGAAGRARTVRRGYRTGHLQRNERRDQHRNREHVRDEFLLLSEMRRQQHATVKQAFAIWQASPTPAHELDECVYNAGSAWSSNLASGISAAREPL